MRRVRKFLVGTALAMWITCSAGAAETVWLSSLDLTRMFTGWGKALEDKAVQGNPMSIAGRRFNRGVGTHAPSRMYVDLGRGSARFQAWVGVDDEVRGNVGSVEFHVYGDGKPLWRSGVMKAGQPAKAVDVNLHGVDTLLLIVDPAGDGNTSDHADWAEARFEVTGVRPKAIIGPSEKPLILTPKPGPEPRINGPRVYGCRPDHPFLYRIPATGRRPMQFCRREATRGADARSGYGHHHRLGSQARRVPGEAPRGQCPGQYRARFQDRLRRPPGAHALDGLEPLVHP